MTRPKWSDSTGKIELLKDHFEPPPGWRWDGDWYVSPELRWVKFIHIRSFIFVWIILLLTYVNKRCEIFFSFLHPSMLYDVDAGHSTFLEDCYECEARIPAGAWGPASIPWADVVRICV